LSTAEGRKFGLTVGAAFLLFAALFWWRGHEWPLRVAGSLGAALVVAGAVIPGHLGPVYRAWMGLALMISKVTTPIVMGILFYVVLTPIGWVRSTFGKHPLRHEAVGDSYWQPRDDGGRGDLTRQF